MNFESEKQDHLIRQLPAYLQSSQKKTQLHELLTDFEFLSQKIYRHFTTSLLPDLLLPLAQEFPRVNAVYQVVERYAHIFDHCEEELELINSLLIRMSNDPDLSVISKKYIDQSSSPMLLPVKPLPDQADPQEIRTMTHNAGIHSLVFSLADDLVYSASREYFLRGWNIETGQEEFALKGHTGNLTRVRLRPGYNSVLTASEDTTLILWDMDSLSIQFVFRDHEDTVNDITISPCGRYAASCSDDKTIKIWSLDTGQLLGTSSELKTTPVCCTYLDSSAQIAVGFSDGQLCLFSAPELILENKTIAHDGDIRAIVFDGKRRQLLSGGTDGQIFSWFTNDLRQKNKYSRHEKGVLDLVLSEDKQYLISSGFDELILFWDLESESLFTGLTGHTAPYSGGLPAVTISADGKLLASGSVHETIKLWRFPTEPQIDFQKPIYGYDCAFHARRNILVTSNGSITFWDASTWAKIFSIPSEDYKDSASVLSPKGDVLWLGTGEGELIKLSFPDLLPSIRIKAHEKGINQIAISKKYIVTASDDGQTKLWDSVSGEIIHQFEDHPSYVLSCAISPDENIIVSAGLEEALFVWDLQSGELVKQLTDHPADVVKCRFSNSGRYMISASHDGTAILWNTKSWQIKMKFEGHLAWVNDAAISPDEKSVATVSQDTTIRIWDIESGETKSIVRVNGWLEGVAWQPEGRHLVAAGEKGIYCFQYLNKQTV